MEIQKNCEPLFFCFNHCINARHSCTKICFFICHAPHILQKNSEIPPKRDFTIIRFNSSKHRSTG